MQTINIGKANSRQLQHILYFFTLSLIIMFSLGVRHFSITMVQAASQERHHASPDEREQRIAAYMTKANQLLQEIQLLTTQPGWPEMAQIIDRSFSVSDFNERGDMIRHRQADVGAWSRKWQTDGQALYRQYLELSDRSKALEAERVGLLEEWQGIRQGLLRIAMWLVVHGEDKVEASIELIKLVSRLDQEHRETLGRYELDAIDLCQER